MTAPNPRLDKLLGGPHTAWLRERLVARLTHGRPLPGKAVLRRPTPEQAAAIAKLLGRPTRQTPATLAVDLHQLEQVLIDAGLCSSLAQAIESIRGPIHNKRAAQDRETARWDALFEQANNPTSVGQPNTAWLENLRQTGLLRQLSKGDLETAQRLLTQAQSVLQQLPHRGITRPVLAAQQTGNSHALDPGKPIATLVLRAITADLIPGSTPAANHPLNTASERYAAWARVGVVENDLTRHTLCLNLIATGDGLTDHTLRLHAEHGQPCSITLRHLIRHTPALTQQTVYLCENPAMIAVAADRLGAQCPPMLCVDGQPGSATHQLLFQLKRTNSILHYHGDFDWPGIAIANQLIQTYQAKPWLMSEHDYTDASKHATIPLNRTPVEPCWSPTLYKQMQQTGLAIHEEMLIEQLLDKLTTS